MICSLGGTFVRTLHANGLDLLLKSWEVQRHVLPVNVDFINFIEVI